MNPAPWPTLIAGAVVFLTPLVAVYLDERRHGRLTPWTRR